MGLSPDPSKWPNGSVLSASGFDNREQIREVLDEMYSTAQEIAGERDKRNTYDTAATEHELEHIDALEAMGHSLEAVGLVVVRRPQIVSRFLGAYSMKAFTQYPKLPPLESAAVAGHPLEPSSVDVALLKNEGFPSVRHLGDAIKLRNRLADSSEQPIPLPKSYKS